MISVEEARDTILSNMVKCRVEAVDICSCSGRVLAEDLVCDIDMPPFHRSAMDGFALRGVEGPWKLVAEITAGTDPAPLTCSGTAAPIMTGAPVPEGADRVVMVERTEISDGMLSVSRLPAPGENICFRAEDIQAGDTVLPAGTLLSAQDAGVAAMAGRSVVGVFRKPPVSILTTGTEVIPPVHVPAPGQVRNANAPLMYNLLRTSGFTPVSSLHAADDPASLENAVRQSLALSDVLVTAGGISMGTRDFIPEVMEGLGFRFLFRTVAQKPGKPFSFAVREADGKVMFGLPGNPVSVLVGLEMYVLSALRYASGNSRFLKRIFEGRVLQSLGKKPGRQYFYRCIHRDGELHVPATSGSGDLMSTIGTDCLAWLPAQSSGTDAGSVVPFVMMSTAGGESCWE